MGSKGTASIGDGVTGGTGGIRIRVAYFLLFLPLLALYPFYYLYLQHSGGVDARVRMAYSPLFAAAGFSDAESFVGPVVALLSLVGIVTGVTYLSVLLRFPLQSMTPSFLALGPFGTTLLGIVVGVAGTLWLAENGLERDLLRRIGASVLLGAGLGLVFVVASVLALDAALAGTVLAEIVLVPTAATLYGAGVANGYVVKRQEFERHRKRRGRGPSASDHTETASHRGSQLSDSEGEAILAAFVDDTWVAPDDLVASSTIQQPREIESLRDIARRLWVEESRYEITVPDTQFSAEQSQHRTDYGQRKRIAPDGFESATYTFFVPGSKEVRSCDDCKGRGETDCARCHRTGSVTCGDCNGSGSSRCSNCHGDGRVTVEETCGVCRGSGETANGWECNNCGGYGSVDRTRPCSNCRNGSVECSRCGGRGEVTCDSCGGRGTLDCGTCDACGRLTSFEYVERSYSPDTEVSYRNRSVPTDLLEDADGERVSLRTDESPGQSGLYRRQDETREIPVRVVTYEYLGDTWEVFDVEGDVQARDFPRDYQRQFRVVQALLAVVLPVYGYLLFVGLY